MTKNFPARYEMMKHLYFTGYYNWLRINQMTHREVEEAYLKETIKN